jgi:hypothetical protein
MLDAGRPQMQLKFVGFNDNSAVNPPDRIKVQLHRLAG